MGSLSGNNKKELIQNCKGTVFSDESTIYFPYIDFKNKEVNYTIFGWGTNYVNSSYLEFPIVFSKNIGKSHKKINSQSQLNNVVDAIKYLVHISLKHAKGFSKNTYNHLEQNHKIIMDDFNEDTDILNEARKLNYGSLWSQDIDKTKAISYGITNPSIL